MVMTPSELTFSMASAISLPISSSPEETVPTRAMSAVPLTFLALLADGGDGGLNGLGHALLHDDGVGARGEVLQTLAHHGLREQCGGGGAVAGDVVGLGGDLTHQLRAHVLKRIVQLDFLGDGHAVVGDQGRAELLVEHDVAALGAERDLNGIGQLIDAGFQSLAGLVPALNHLRHMNYLQIKAN